MGKTDAMRATSRLLIGPRAILGRLATGDASAMELAEPFAMRQPAISKHLKVLERAGMISSGNDARRCPRSLEARPMAKAIERLEQYRELWEASFLRLDDLLSEPQAPRKKSLRKKRERS